MELVPEPDGSKKVHYFEKMLRKLEVSEICSPSISYDLFYTLQQKQTHTAVAENVIDYLKRQKILGLSQFSTNFGSTLTQRPTSGPTTVGAEPIYSQ